MAAGFKKILNNLYLANFAIAALYFATAYLSLSLAVPPGYATPVWPAAGLALAFMIHFGPRISYGIFFGSFCINLFITLSNMQAPFTLEACILPVLIGSGAVLNPLISKLFLKIINLEIKSLISATEIFGIIIIGGFIGCIVSATIGTLSLYYMRAISLDGFIQTWFTWWTGDTLGVFVFTPITVLYFANFRITDKRFLSVSIPLLLCFIFSIFGYFKFSEKIFSDMNKKFSAQSSTANFLVLNSFHKYENSLTSIKYFYENSEDVAREDFRNYTKLLLKELKGTLLLQWSSFTESKDDHFSVVFVEPFDGNEDKIGHDISSNVGDFSKLSMSWDHNQLVSSGVMKMLPGYKSEATITLSIPVFERENRKLTGVVSGVFRVRNILMDALKSFDMDGIDYILYQEETYNADNENVLKSFSGELTDNEILMSSENRFEVGGKTWVLKTFALRSEALKNIDWSIWILFSSTLIISGFLGIILLVLSGQTQNISEEVDGKTKALEEKNAELIKSNEQIEKISSYKSQFLANMSHEIRTPLNGILGMLELIDDTNLSNNQRSSLETVKVASENLYTIINDILDFSKIEAGKLQIENVEFNLRKIIENTFLLFRKQAEDKGIDLKIIIDKSCPHFVSSDPVRISQVISNLLSNAIKFTNEGSVKLEVRAVVNDNYKTSIFFKIEDTGIGIDKEMSKKLFNPFSQVDSSTTRNFGGTGLGLVICKKIIDLFGGEINLISEVGVGTKIDFRIVCDLTSQRDGVVVDDSIPSTKALKFLKVLVVEDNLINQKVIKLLLGKLNVDIDIASNGAEGIEIANLKEYDVIFMDLQMPICDGFNATKAIKADSMNKATPIIPMTANVFKEDRDKCVEYGMKDFIEKPIKMDKLKEVLSNIVNHKYDLNI